MTSKTEIRRQALRNRRAMSLSDREIASLAITDFFIASPWFLRAKNIGCYLPAFDEVDTRNLIQRAWRMKKRIFVPVIEKNSSMKFVHFHSGSKLRRNRFGLHEPEPDTSISPASPPRV